MPKLTEEQVDALADVFAQYAISTNPTGLSVGIDSAYSFAEALAESPALQEIIRATQKETAQNLADSYPALTRDMVSRGSVKAWIQSQAEQL